MLAFALVAVALLAVLPNIKQQIQREREEELCHRGTAYMRAIRLYYKKFGKYPTRVEDLENTNNIRFLRKRYTDPMTRDPQTGRERDFKILHMQDVLLNSGPVLGAQGEGQMGALQGSGGLQPPKSTSSNSDAGTPAGDIDSSNAASAENLNSLGNSNIPSAGLANSGDTGSSSNGSGAGGQIIGGGPIVGVMSTSKEKTIREFNKKSHYNEWYFIYDSSILAPGPPVGPWIPGNAIMGGAPVMAPGGISQTPAGQSQIGSGVAPQSGMPQQN
jgi:type II secretory pathway pseudopilin PulG